ncbi:T9SS type B sorting domain-containing protein [Aggregatimonas sangjinii]|uniref:T9SS type B sorting domain-containing protein n=1 Tax=Aggregatimonas sangjinii TaxID=2583587 RepID=A0A5B7SUN5_9FLAO|nr:T9SS type B sorting domain-containing protein [Aggregatimonas sangjinii]QCX00758.1 T9SS type B sorting domain-containing protein [Aggregatimonas sangjinii]
MKKIIFSLFLLISIPSWSQQANDCIDAVVVCGNNQIASNASGFGTQELDNQANPCAFEEVNSLWFQLTIGSTGELAFDIVPDSDAITVDYDFYVFGPNFSCDDFTDPVRCSTTNPSEAGLTYNTTGLRSSENDDSEGPGANGNSYVDALSVQAGETYYLLIDRPHGGGGFELDWTGTAQFLPGPEVQEPSNIEVCLSEAIVEVDLTSRETQITQSPDVQIDYFNSFANAFDFEDEINAPDRFAFSGARENIYVRVTNTLSECFEIVDFTVTALEFNDPPDIEQVVCDTDRDGAGVYDLLGVVSDIEDTLQNPAEFVISLYRNEIDAMASRNPLILASYTTFASVLYARVSSVQLGNCFTTFPVMLTIEENPYPAVIELTQCDVDEADSLDGITRTNLEQAFPDNPDSVISFYESIGARGAGRAIAEPSNYTNQTPFDQVLYYRTTSGDCFSDGELQLTINPTLVSLQTASPFMVCADATVDGMVQGTFDLEEIRANQYAGLDVAFYANRDDLSLERNRLTGILNTPTTTIYARLEANNQCQGAEQLDLVVNALPEIGLETSYQVCTDGEPLVLQAPEGFDSYTWYSGTDGAFMEIGDRSELTITEAGDYRLMVGTLYEMNGQSVVCNADFDFSVSPSNAATIQNIEIEEFSAENSVEITVSGDGDYEYSLDGENYQNEAGFENTAAGFYTVFVRDKNGCGISEEDISIIGYPKFFTPNADGVNDTWQLLGLNDTEGIVTSVSIYDRYGKLIRMMTDNDSGWDGTLNGAPLPASDYWFRIALEGRKEVKGHFTLKR